ncbi:glucan endo-1,6-beta-glucosidase [Bifidobacterium animalis subsp. lactis ATCC 27673]|uniref:glycoside hydrolase family 30 protein n=1 Tax=Bifidobacterium animalis TaxID=28025 RepID=UPI0003B0AA89|nr:glucan endo-1,6-beta-glucosidase [Bifidobacterium animalis]AGW85609.1 glucan endo-1,6-beta-glucosidase [Bifidobacterium animalis subsp. lactis ATCC 27673]KOA44110.1 glucan endo-1,6-beta-glucosidase [Bifidobacterium animalis subsp. lactis ATCC 27673]
MIQAFSTYANAQGTTLAAAFAPLGNVCLRVGRTPESTSHASTPTLSIDTTRVRQPIDGFGASITEATSWLWHNRVTDKERCIRDLFSPRDGIGISMLRQPIGPSDHVSAPYRFVRRFPDRNLNSLDFTPEMERVLPMVEAANDCALATQSHALNIMASPWSAPWWMKTNLSVLGKRRYTRITGHLRRGMYAAYARYITGFARLYAQRGLPLFALTVTNEPDYPQSRWPSMAMTPREQAEFVARHLRPMLDHAGLDGTRILCWDHNYSTDHYPDGAFVRDMYADSAALAACAGSAWHYYGGSARTMSRIHDAFPNKGIWATEASGGDWGPRNFTPALLSLGTAVIDMMNNWARSAVLWNIALDEHGGPDYYYLRNDRRHSENRGLITVRDDGSIRRNADYYALGHFSKYVPIGSRCVECALDHAQGVRAAAFLVPAALTHGDGDQVVAVLVNSRPEPLDLLCHLRGAGNGVMLTLPASSLTSFLA